MAKACKLYPRTFLKVHPAWSRAEQLKFHGFILKIIQDVYAVHHQDASSKESNVPSHLSAVVLCGA